MKKYQVRNFAETFGKSLPIAKVSNPTTRREIILLATSLAKPAKDIEEEISAVSAKLVEGHEEEIRKWSELTMKAKNCPDDKERKKLIKEQESCTEAIRIDKEFQEAQLTILNEDSPDFPVRKVSLDTLIEALLESGLLLPEANITGVAEQFAPIIKD